MSTTALFNSVVSSVESDGGKPHSSQQSVSAIDVGMNAWVSEQEFDMEVEYSQTVFPVEGTTALVAATPLRLGYHDSNGTLEVIGWGLTVDLRGGSQLPRLIARRFLELFSKVCTVGLSEDDEKHFERICQQIDYRAFCASRMLPRYQEMTLLRKFPCLVQPLSLRPIKLESDLLPQLHVLNEGDYFGAWFTLGPSGDITDIRNVTLLPRPSHLPKMTPPVDGR